MLPNYDTIFTKKVLIEKIADPCKELFIYIAPKSTLKRRAKDLLRQVRCGKDWSQKLNMKTKVMAETSDEPMRHPDIIFGKSLLSLLRMVSQRQVKNIFVYDVNYFCNNKYITAFIISFLNKYNVHLYTEDGLYKTDSDNYSKFSGMISFLKDYDLFTEIINEDAEVYNRMVEEMKL